MASRVGAECNRSMDQAARTRTLIDDHFASFYYLEHLTFDSLKIDGEFTKELASSEIDQLLVRSVAGIARALGKRTIAECVGDAETMALLQREGGTTHRGSSSPTRRRSAPWLSKPTSSPSANRPDRPAG